MNTVYTRTQIGYMSIAVLTGALFFITYLVCNYGLHFISLTLMVILGLFLVFFSTLTVSLDDSYLKIQFGSGLISKKFSLRDIESCLVVKNPWYYGWGIHLSPHGWLFNVSGLHAVEIRMKTGSKYRIGTNAPVELEKAVRERMASFLDSL